MKNLISIILAVFITGGFNTASGQESSKYDTMAQYLVYQNIVRSSSGGVIDSLMYQVSVTQLPPALNQEFNVNLRILSRGIYDGSRMIHQTDLPGISEERMELCLIVPDDRVDVRKFRSMNFYNMNSRRWEPVSSPSETYQIAEKVIGPALRFMMGFIPLVGSDISLLQGIASISSGTENPITYSLEQRNRVMEFESEYDIIPIPIDPIPGDEGDWGGYRNYHLGGYEFIMPMVAKAADAKIRLSIGPITTAPRGDAVNRAEFSRIDIPLQLDKLAWIRRNDVTIRSPGPGVVELKGNLRAYDRYWTDKRLFEQINVKLDQNGRHYFRVSSTSGKISVHSIKKFSASGWSKVSGRDMKWKREWWDTNVWGTGVFAFYIMADEPGVSGDYTFTIISPNSIRPEVTYMGKPAVPLEAEAVPEKTELQPNYPNPFNAETIIPFAIGNESSGEHARLSIYDILGQEVAILIDEPLPAGTYSAKWDGLDADGKQVGSGTYFYKLRAGKMSLTRTMVLAK